MRFIQLQRKLRDHIEDARGLARHACGAVNREFEKSVVQYIHTASTLDGQLKVHQISVNKKG